MEALALIFGIILVDLVLSGDNAVVVASAANGLPKELRDKAILYGVGLAIVLRVFATGVAGWLFGFKGVAIIGGAALVYIAYKLAMGYFKPDTPKDETASKKASDIVAAVTAIVLADISMSLDNIAAIAALAKGHFWLMAFGLIVSVAIMGIGAKIVSLVMERYKWITLVAAAFIGLLGLHMAFGSFFSR